MNALFIAALVLDLACAPVLRPIAAANGALAAGWAGVFALACAYGRALTAVLALAVAVHFARATAAALNSRRSTKEGDTR